MIEAQTFTGVYDTVEDRIRLIINYASVDKRVDLMITRSFVLKLLPAIEEYYIKNYNEELIVQDFSNKRVPQEVDKGVSQTQIVELELTKVKDELLTKIDLSLDTQTKKTKILFHTREKQVISLLDKEMLRKVVGIIQSAIPKIPWGINALL